MTVSERWEQNWSHFYNGLSGDIGNGSISGTTNNLQAPKQSPVKSKHPFQFLLPTEDPIEGIYNLYSLDF